MIMINIYEYCKQNLLVNEYLLSKDKTMSAKFPKTPKTDNIISFLEQEEFDKYEVGYYEPKISVKDFCSLKNKRLGISDKNLFTRIYFCLDGEINEKNPIFCLYTTDDGHEYYQYSEKRGKYVGVIEQYDHIFKYFKTYEDFSNEAKKFFGW